MRLRYLICRIGQTPCSRNLTSSIYLASFSQLWAATPLLSREWVQPWWVEVTTTSLNNKLLSPNHTLSSNSINTVINKIPWITILNRRDITNLIKIIQEQMTQTFLRIKSYKARLTQSARDTISNLSKHSISLLKVKCNYIKIRSLSKTL